MGEDIYTEISNEVDMFLDINDVEMNCVFIF